MIDKTLNRSNGYLIASDKCEAMNIFVLDKGKGTLGSDVTWIFR